MLESEVAKRVRLALQKIRVTLFRNNVGHVKTADNRYVKFGLCEGSSDYIGWTEHIITPEDVGRNVAVFTAIEAKRSKGGKVSDAQWSFIGRVQLAGGIAGVAESEEAAKEIVTRWKAYE